MFRDGKEMENMFSAPSHSFNMNYSRVLLFINDVMMKNILFSPSKWK